MSGEELNCFKGEPTRLRSRKVNGNGEFLMIWAVSSLPRPSRFIAPQATTSSPICRDPANDAAKNSKPLINATCLSDRYENINPKFERCANMTSKSRILPNSSTSPAG